MAVLIKCAAADLSGVETPIVGGINLRSKFRDEWGAAEESNFAQLLLPPCSIPLPPQPERAMLLALSFRIDVAALNEECCWDDVWLGARLPGVAAAARVLKLRLRHAQLAASKVASRGMRTNPRGNLAGTAYAGARQQRADTSQHAMAPVASSLFYIGGISCGSSGLASISGEVVLTRRWADLATTLRSLGVDVAVATGCRQPVPVRAAMPDFFYDCIGPVSTSFDAACLLTPARPDNESALQWRKELSDTNRVTIATRGEDLIICGFYVPPHNENHGTEARLAVLELVFDAIDRARAHFGADRAIIGYGDLNPCPVIRKRYNALLAEKALQDLIPIGIPTHVAGRSLDVAFRSANPDMFDARAIVHNGSHCRTFGCLRPQCGQHVQTYGSADLDHWPVVIEVGGLPGTSRLRPQQCSQWRTVFSKDVFLWQQGLGLTDGFSSLLAVELQRSAQHAATWAAETIPETRRAMEAVAWTWRAASLFAAICTGLFELRQAQRGNRRATADIPNNITPDFAQEQQTLALAQVSERQRLIGAKIDRLLDSNPSEAEAYLSRLLKDRQEGLPPVMADPANPSKLIHGHSVLEAMADYVAHRGQDRMDAIPASQQASVIARARQLVIAGRRSATAAQHRRAYTETELAKSTMNIDPTKECFGIPYAAVRADVPGHREALLQEQDMYRRLMVIPLWLKRQPVHGKRKTGKDKQLQASYRQLALSCAQLRTAEELWATRSEEILWLAVGPTQHCRSDSLLAVLIDIDASLVRMDLGLPEAVLATDLEEAHDTAWPEQMIVSMAEVAQITGEDLVLASELLVGTSIFIATPTDRSRPVPLTGLPEGRRLATSFFAILATAFPRRLAGRHIGVGLNPPPEGVLWYHMTATGATNIEPDVHECRDMAERIAGGRATWQQTMSTATSDAHRLGVLDAASPVRVGLIQYSDDNRLKSSSNGMQTNGAVCLTEAVEDIRGKLRTGSGNTEFLLRSLPARGPLPMGSAIAHACEILPGLGVPRDVPLRMSALLRQVETRGGQGCHTVLAAEQICNLPACVLLKALAVRLVPKACHVG